METTVAVSKYLTFMLGPEEYGLPVLKVREIIRALDVTRVPQVPDHVLGVVNLRGRVIPVIDLRRKLGLPYEPPTERTCIVVADVALASSTVMMGVVVDSVSEVLTVSADELEETPQLGRQVTAEYVLGLAKVKGSVKILLDLDRVLGQDAPIELRAY